jgi:DNA polymerase-1
MRHLLHAGIDPKNLGCTLLADRVIHGKRKTLKKELKLSTTSTLKALAKESLEIDISKEMQTSDWSVDMLTEEQLEYAALDAVLVARLFRKQQPILKKKELTRSYSLYRDAQHALAKMERVGIGFDVNLHKEKITCWKAQQQEILEGLTASIGKGLNLNSSKQIGEWLKEVLDEKELRIWTRTKKTENEGKFMGLYAPYAGQLSTSTPTFKQKELLRAEFSQIVSYRQVSKLISSFGENLYPFIDERNNRLYGSFSLGETATGRMTSRNPNLQNMPRQGFRDVFIARDGYVLIGADYSQQELRVAALISGDRALLKIYKDGGDVHMTTAAALLKIPLEEVTKQQRQLAKAVAFGLLYGQGAKGLARYAKQTYSVEMTVEQAEENRRSFFKTYRGLREWQKMQGKTVELTQKAYTQCGRVRDFSREEKGYRFSESLNHPIQGSAAEITLRAITRITSLLDDEIHLVNVVHDEIVVECVEHRADEVLRTIETEMVNAFLDIFPTAVPYLMGLVEGKIGKNWASLK